MATVQLWAGECQLSHLFRRERGEVRVAMDEDRAVVGGCGGDKRVDGGHVGVCFLAYDNCLHGNGLTIERMPAIYRLLSGYKNRVLQLEPGVRRGMSCS